MQLSIAPKAELAAARSGLGSSPLIAQNVLTSDVPPRWNVARSINKTTQGSILRRRQPRWHSWDAGTSKSNEGGDSRGADGGDIGDDVDPDMLHQGANSLHESTDYGIGALGSKCFCGGIASATFWSFGRVKEAGLLAKMMHNENQNKFAKV